jgi:hypothetical protein
LIVRGWGSNDGFGRWREIFRAGRWERTATATGRPQPGGAAGYGQAGSREVTAGQSAVYVTVSDQGTGHGQAAQQVTLQVLGPGQGSAITHVNISC